MTKKSKMQERADNRTGVGIVPDRTKSMLEDVRGRQRARTHDTGEANAVRIELQREAPPAGTMPPMVAPEKQTHSVLLDKLGERLAFERVGARLYELLAIKLDAMGGFPGGPTRADLERIRDEELEHLGMLSETIGSYGGDPTAITPAANVATVESAGLVQVLADPRSSLADGLHAVLTAELVDTEAWTSLVQLAQELGHRELAETFARANAEEAEHLRRLRDWVDGEVHVRLSA